MRPGALGVTTHARPCFGRRASRGFTLLAALERVVEGQAVVARGHRLVGLGECGGGRRELGGGVLFGARCTRRGKGTTGLANLLAGWIGAGGGHRNDEARCRAQQESATHHSIGEYSG